MAEVKLEDAPSSIRTYYDKGISAMERDNLEYAMDMFEAALGIEPRLLQIRKLLRAAAVKKVKSTPPGKLAVAKAMPGLLKATSILKKSPLKALEISEQLLRVDPFNLKFTKALCDAAEAAGLPEIAIQMLEVLKDNKPENLQVLEPLARLYSEMESYESEYECRSTIAKLKPNDTNASKELKDAAARLTMGKAGWQKAESFRDIIREDTLSPDTADKIEQLQKQVDDDPQNPDKRLALANHQLSKKLYAEAIQNLEDYRDLSGTTDPQLERKLITAREHQVIFEIAEAEDSHDRKQVSLLRKKLTTMRIDNAGRQVERYPNDLQLKYDYGKLLIENGNYTEAIQQLQQALRNPQRRTRSLIYLAQAFKQKEQPEIALEQLETALANLQTMDNQKKEVLYELGTLCEILGNTDQAKRYLKEIYAVDIGYRDVASRIENSTDT